MTALRALTKPHSEVVRLAENDLQEVAAFIARESGKGPQQVEAHLRWFLLENPARQKGIPLGWGLRGEHGELAGCLLSSPQDFRFRTQHVPLMGSTCFYVDSAHRSVGALIFLKYSRLNDRWALFGNSANAEAASLWKGRGATPIPDSDRELLGPIRWGPVLEDVIFRKTGRSSASRFVGKLGAGVASVFRHLNLDSGLSVDLAPLTSAEDAAELTTSTPPEQLTSVRDVSYLRWRYFSRRDPTLALFAFRSQGVDRPVLVAVNERTRGRRDQIRSINLLDLYPAVDPEICLQVVTGLYARYRERVDMIVLRCMDPRRQKVFQKAGFLMRKFHGANGWFLDKHNLLPVCDFYLVPGDGDWII
jgi:hypothetical protein